MSIYGVPLTLQVCQALGCRKAASMAVWDDRGTPAERPHLLLGRFCLAHSDKQLRGATR